MDEINNENQEQSEVINETQEQTEVDYESKIAHLTKERDQFKNLAMHMKADFDNFRKRLDSESKQYADSSIKKMVLDLLNVMDSYELAIKNFDVLVNNFDCLNDKQKNELNNNFNGIVFTYEMLKTILNDKGVTEIEIDLENNETTFNPNYHEALFQEKTNKCKDKVILEVFQKGYLYNGQILRTAKVKIACKIDGGESDE